MSEYHNSEGCWQKILALRAQSTQYARTAPYHQILFSRKSLNRHPFQMPSTLGYLNYSSSTQSVPNVCTAHALQ